MGKQVFLPAILLLAVLMSGQANAKTARYSHKQHAAAVSAAPAPGLEKRLAQWKPYPVEFDERTLLPRERQMLEKLVAASRCIEDIYWRQSDPEGLELLQSLEGKKDATSKSPRRTAATR
ncbi:MAG: hypothetical protein HYX28_07660 [Candidatus Koribacter versatilis]|uniref:Uncharacterized protein n=1 Tax=Candidatus Korobacter versatilis TaxID=658062 RepID=A0A932EPY7_9BACT|nr:hypothetical protein [Candidatus Koribacter versatilis]